MIIKELKIKNFGKLKDKVISFDNGLNVLSGNNETGKTTVITFIRFMLYGGQGRTNPVKDYFPLDLSDPSGEMVISHNDQEYLIVRKGAKKKGSYAVVTNLSTGDVITGEKAESIISEIVSISEDMFASTVYAKDISESTFLAKSEILKRLENLSSSGDELVNYEEIIASLNEEKSSLTSLKRKDAVIPKLMKKAEDTEKEIYQLSDRIRAKEALETELESAIREEAELTHSVENGSDEADNVLFNLNQTLVELNQTISETENMIPQEFLAFDDGEMENVQKLEKLLHNKLEYFCYVCFLIFGVISTVFGFLPYVIPVIAFILIIGNFVYFSYKRNKLKSILLRYNVNNGEELMTKVSFCRQKNTELTLFKKKRDEISLEIIKLGKQKENNKNILAENMKRTVEAVTRKNRIQTELDSIGKYELLLKEKQHIYKEIKESLEKYSEYVKIIDDTKEMISDAYEKLKKDFSPAVSDIAGRVFSFVTGISGEKIVVSEDLTLSLRRGDALYPLTNLSRSTLDLIYFSFRMAVIETVIDKSGVIIFDEAFIRYDKDRLSKALSYLGNSSHQIIFSTFSEYELKFIKDNCDYNLIQL